MLAIGAGLTVLVEGGIISQQEERKRVAEDPSTPYAGLDKNKMPALKEEEMEGLVPEGGGRVTAELEKEEAGGEDPSGERQENPSGEEPDEGEDEIDVDSESNEVDPVASARQGRTGKLVDLVHKIGQERTRDSTPEDEARKPRTGKLTKLLKVLDAAE